MITHKAFIESLIESFPELREETQDEICAGLLHVEMGCFAGFTQRAIDEHDVANVKRCFAFADNLFRNADAEVKNAVYVSYLESLNFSDGKQWRAWALDYLPLALRTGYKDINDYLDELFRNRR